MTRWADETSDRGATYDDAWTAREADGESVHGEADLVRWLLARDEVAAPAVLDAGCGTGRVAIELARHGIDVVGVDLDDSMLARAREKAPALDWRRVDVTTMALGRTFDVVVMAGNVMIFLAPGTEEQAVGAVARHLADGGLFVAGFQLQPGRLDLAGFDAHAAAHGLSLVDRWATWERDPWTGGDYAVSVLRHQPVM